MASEAADEPGEQAVRLARAAAGLEGAVEGRAFRVRRLDRPGTFYYLTLLGTEAEPVAIAAVDLERGETLTWAELRGGRHLRLDGEDAIRRAGLEPDATAELVWRSSAASRSPLYPLWEVRGDDRVVYVDHAGTVWDELTPGPRGG